MHTPVCVPRSTFGTPRPSSRDENNDAMRPSQPLSRKTPLEIFSCSPREAIPWRGCATAFDALDRRRPTSNAPPKRAKLFVAHVTREHAHSRTSPSPRIESQFQTINHPCRAVACPAAARGDALGRSAFALVAVRRWRWRWRVVRVVVVDVPCASRRANRRRVAHCGVTRVVAVRWVMSQPLGDFMR